MNTIRVGQAELDAARLLLARMGISPADLLTGGVAKRPAPTFAEYVPVVAKTVTDASRRVQLLRDMDDAVLRTIARLDGMPFPSTAEMGWRWLRSRVPRRTVRLPVRIGPALRRPGRARALETAYCAEVVAMTYSAMGLLRPGRDASWFDPGRFWSGDTLRLTRGARLGEEIAVTIPPG